MDALRSLTPLQRIGLMIGIAGLDFLILWLASNLNDRETYGLVAGVSGAAAVGAILVLTFSGETTKHKVPAAPAPELTTMDRDIASYREYATALEKIAAAAEAAGSPLTATQLKAELAAQEKGDAGYSTIDLVAIAGLVAVSITASFAALTAKEPLAFLVIGGVALLGAIAVAVLRQDQA